MKPIFLLGALALNGCATYNEQFDCEPGIGVGCKSLSTVNQMLDEGALPLHEQEEISTAGETPLISSPKHLRVWIARHTDEDGITHEPSVLSLPLKTRD